MATYAYTFTSGDVVTPTKLNNARTVSEIVNADIKSDAAIAGTKIAPDFGAQNVVTTGKELVGAATEPSGDFVYSSTVSSAGARQTVVSGHATGNAGSAVVRYSSNTTSQAFMAMLKLAKSNTTTSGEHVAVVDGQAIGGMSLFGSDGTNFINGATVSAFVDGAVAAGSVPMRLSFSTKAAGSTASPTERMRITSDGNVGIANTSPTEKLHVTGNIKLSGYVDADTSFRGQSSDSASAPSFTWTGDTDTGMFRPAANTLAFCEGGAEAMRINSSGEVLINTTTAIDTSSGSADGFTFNDANLSVSTNNAGAMFLRRRSSNGAIVTFRRDTTTVGTISVTTTATSYNESSDYRLKENPTPITGALDTVAALKPVDFTWKVDGSAGRGFIAHELQAVAPEAVTGEKDAVDAEGNPEYQGVDKSKLVPLLVAAVQELSAKVATLEADQ